MTATISNKTINKIRKDLDIIPINLNKSDLNKIANNSKKIAIKPKPLTAKSIIKNHKKKTIVVCNTVARTQNLFKDVRETLKSKQDIEVVCIHSRFF